MRSKRHQTASNLILCMKKVHLLYSTMDYFLCNKIEESKYATCISFICQKKNGIVIAFHNQLIAKQLSILWSSIKFAKCCKIMQTYAKL